MKSAKAAGQKQRIKGIDKDGQLYGYRPQVYEKTSEKDLF